MACLVTIGNGSLQNADLAGADLTVADLVRLAVTCRCPPTWTSANLTNAANLRDASLSSPGDAMTQPARTPT